MTTLNGEDHPLVIRLGSVSDTTAIAALHALSWMHTYRGLLSDEYLDNGLADERAAYWTAKMHGLSPRDFVLVAELNDEVVGFLCLLDKPEKGYDAFIDNLHVRTDLKGAGIGTKLIAATAEKLRETGRVSFYLWVLEGNVAAEKFYLGRGAHIEDTSHASFGGKTVNQTRFCWKTWH